DSGSIQLSCIGDDSKDVALSRTGCFKNVQTNIVSVAPSTYRVSLDDITVEIVGVNAAEFDGIDVGCIAEPPMGDLAPTLIAEAGPGGAISPGTTIVERGAAQTFQVTPDTCFRIADVL